MTTRVATNTSYAKSVYYMQMNNAKLEKATEQFNTGKKFQTSSEAPADFAETMRLENDIAMYETYSDNAAYAVESLYLEESALDSINTELNRAYTLVQSAVNGRNDETDLNSIATELEEIQKHIYSLMNTTTSDGEYVFSGTQGSTQSFIYRDGSYSYQGDSGQRGVQVTGSSTISVSDPGSTIFEMTATAREVAGIEYSYSNYDDFESFFDKHYDFETDTNNSYSITYLGNNEYSITNGDGSVSETCSASNSKIKFNGLSISVNESNANFKLEKPTNDNILNVLSSAIKALKNDENVNDIMAKTEISIRNTQSSVNTVMGKIGGRENSLENILDANSELSEVKTNTKAKISEADVYETTTNMTKYQTSLEMAMKSFSYVTGTSLFDYI